MKINESTVLRFQENEYYQKVCVHVGKHSRNCLYSLQLLMD